MSTLSTSVTAVTAAGAPIDVYSCMFIVLLLLLAVVLLQVGRGHE